MADPAGIDQGLHDTCTATALTEYLVTKSPAVAAEMMATSALTGGWRATDGKQIKIEAGSLLPGPEESVNPPKDGDRSYATQLLTVGLANDIAQRRSPAMFYSQERSPAKSDTGERLRYADGTRVMDDDKTPARHAMINIAEIGQEGRRLNGDTGFVFAHVNIKQYEFSDEVMKVERGKQLRAQLTDLKAAGKLPAIFLVDGDAAFFAAAGDTKGGFLGDSTANKKTRLHALSVTDYDAVKDKIRISNQWGRGHDIDVSVFDFVVGMRPDF